MHHQILTSIRRSIACAALTVCASVGALAANVDINYQVDLNTWTVLNGTDTYTISNGDRVSVEYAFVGGKDLQVLNTSLSGAYWTPGWAWLKSNNNDSDFQISDIHVSLLDSTVVGTADVDQYNFFEANGIAHLGPSTSFLVDANSSVTFSGLQATFTVDDIAPNGKNTYSAWFQTYNPVEPLQFKVVTKGAAVPDASVTVMLLGSVFGLMVWARRKSA